MALLRARNASMTEGSIQSRILFFAIPVLIGNLFQQLYNTVDSLIVGNCLGAEALAAVTSTGSLIYIVMGFFNGFAMGAGTVIARHIGARDSEASQKTVHTAVTLGLIFSVIVSIAGYFLAGPVLRIMGSPDDVWAQSTAYLRLYYAGSFAVILYNVFVGILQANGDSTHPLIYLVISSLLNTVLDLVFIMGLHMGVEGAAIATVLSQCVSAVLAMLRLRRSPDTIRLSFKNIGLDGDSLKWIVRYGLPTAMQSSVIDLSNVLIQSYINSFGSVAMAGIGAYLKIESFSFLPITAFQIAICTFISQNIGAKEFARARKGIKFGVATAVLLSGSIGILVLLFARPLLGVFNRDPEVIRYGMMRAYACAGFMCLAAYAHAMSAVMRGIGKPMTPMVVMLVCWCAVRVLVLMTIGRVWHDFRLVCYIYPITWGISVVVYTLYALHLRKEFPWLRGMAA